MDTNFTLIGVSKLGRTRASLIKYILQTDIFFIPFNSGSLRKCVKKVKNIFCVCVCVCFQRNRGILLGVAGTDVPVSELLKTIPKYKVPHPASRSPYGAL